MVFEGKVHQISSNRGKNGNEISLHPGKEQKDHKTNRGNPIINRMMSYLQLYI